MGKLTTKARHWADHFTEGRGGLTRVGFLSFLESTVLPIPLEIVVAPLMATQPKRAIPIAVAIWVGCLIGAALFYGLAVLLYEPVVQPALDWAGYSGALEDIRDRLGEQGTFLAIFLVSVTPVPFQIATLGAGAAGANMLVFLAAVALSRGIRYFGLALLAQLIGPEIVEKLSEPKWKITAAVVGLALAWGAWMLLG
ncbi:hypothetical protein [Roseobacter sp. HKCCA0434]|uniref:YqaA family protein n=1 Tax=Roseobacter sp. HKCCA0434 TaxID=3079297 RepID=UPI002905BD8C|nr:hypothetical protein [Roseobacter sp. HKCCA0434]